MILDRPAIFAASLLLIGFFMTKAANGHNIDKRPPPISQPSDPQSPPTTASSTTTASATTTPTTTTTMTTANISNQRHRRINQNSQIPTVETSSSSIDYDDDESENRHQNAQIPSTVLSLQDHYHKSESTSRINTSQTRQEVVIPTTAAATTKTTTKPHAQSILETLKQSSGVAQGIHHQSQPSAPRDLTVEGSGDGPPSSRRNQNVEKFDDTEDGNDDEDEDDEDYNDRIQESGSGRVVQGSLGSKPLESMIKPADTMGVLQPHVYRDSHKTGDTNSSSLNKSIGTTSIDQTSRIPQTDVSKLVIQSTQLPPLKDLSTTSPSPPTILNSINFNSSYLSPQSSSNQPMKPIRPQQILPTTSPVLYTPLANSPANHTTKAGKNSTKNHDEYTDYDDESDDDDSEDISNFEDNESTDEQPIVVNRTTTSHQAHHTVFKTTTTTTMRPLTKPVSQSSPQPPPPTPGVEVPRPSQNTQIISTSATALNNVVNKLPSASTNPPSTTKLPDLPDSIVDDVGSDDDEDDEDEDEEDDDDNEDVIDDNIDESGGHFTSMTPPIPPSTSKATITTTTTSTTTATPTTTTTTTTSPPTTLPTYVRIASTSATSQPASSSTLAPSQPSLLAAPTPRIFAVTKPPSSPPVPISPANRYTPIRYATTPTDRSIPASTGTSSILTYGKSSSVDDEIDLTLQLYNKAVEIYQSASNAIQSTVNSVWPPSFEARTNFLEPLMAQPLLFMLALGGAIIGLVLSMMLVVYIVSSQIEPKDDVSIY